MSIKVLLSLVMTLFVGILIVVWVICRDANPVFLDERGKPLVTSR